MTMTQYLPKWLRGRLRKPAPQKVTRLSKKARQVLHTLPSLKQSSTEFQEDESPAGFRILWRQ
jgi:hypothetical protein